MVGRSSWWVVLAAGLLPACELGLTDAEYAADADPVQVRFRVTSFDPRNLTDLGGGALELAGSLYLAQGPNAVANARSNIQQPTPDGEGHRNARLAFWNKEVAATPGPLKLDEWKYEVRKSEVDALVARSTGQATTDQAPYIVFSAWESDSFYVDSAIGTWSDTYVGYFYFSLASLRNPKTFAPNDYTRVKYDGLTADGWHRYKFTYQDVGTGSAYEPNGHVLLAEIEAPADPGSTDPAPAPAAPPGPNVPSRPGAAVPSAPRPGPAPIPGTAPAPATPELPAAGKQDGGCSAAGNLGGLLLTLLAAVGLAARRGSRRA